MTTPMSANDVCYRLQVTLLGRPAGLDELLEAASALMFAGWELAHREAEKVEAHVALMGVQRVGNVGLFVIEAQFHLRQPICGLRLQGQQRLQVGVQNHQAGSA